MAGAGRARQMLAAAFPGGSARSELKRRVFMLAEQGNAQSAATSKVIEEIVEELVKASEDRYEAERQAQIMGEQG